MQPLPREFYDRDAEAVAPELLGTLLAHRSGGVLRVGRVVEAEAYLGPHDLAAHSSKGRTRRTEVMFGPPGHAYVYLIYGMYHCLNAVTGPGDQASAVLIRALEPVRNVEGNTKGPACSAGPWGSTGPATASTSSAKTSSSPSPRTASRSRSSPGPASGSPTPRNGRRSRSGSRSAGTPSSLGSEPLRPTAADVYNGIGEPSTAEGRPAHESRSRREAVRRPRAGLVPRGLGAE